MIGHKMPFNNFHTFVRAQLFYNISNISFVLIINYFSSILWSEGYYVSTVGVNDATVRKYIQEQERYDIMQDKLSVKEYEDPFKG